MSIIQITTHVIECDDCHERFGDVVELAAETMLQIAKRNLWEDSAGVLGIHRCPTCANKKHVAKLYKECPECRGNGMPCQLCFGAGQVFRTIEE